MRRFLLTALVSLALAWPLAAAAPAHAQTPSCTLSENASGALVASVTGLEPSYYWAWALYADGVTPPAGYTPWLDYDYFSSDAAGNAAITMNTVASYEGFYPGLGPYSLKFDVFDLHGSKNVIGTNRLSSGTGFLVTCSLA